MESTVRMSVRSPEAGEHRSKGIHVYADKCGLEIYPVESRQGEATVQIDAAPRSDQSTRWSEKIVFQVHRRELPALDAALSGYLAACELQYHGPAKDKHFSLRWQEDGQRFFVRVGQGRVQLALPMFPADAFFVHALVRAQLMRHLDGIDTAGVESLLREFARRGHP